MICRVRQCAVLTVAGLFLITGLSVAPVFGLSPGDVHSIRNHTPFYDPTDTGSCQSGAATPGAPAAASTSGATNLDYSGKSILNSAQLQAITQNQSVYQQAAQQEDVPWQMLAVVHLREHGLKVSNPSNGQGIYQFASKQGGPYPTGPVSQAEFLRQTILAAKFLKSKAKGSNSSGNNTLTVSSSAATIKDTFFSYNGRNSGYVAQAVSLGFPAAQGYEGSPYVMNRADAKRDPVALGPNERSWGQVKVDFGPIEYPANSDYGAFVEYAALAGIAVGGGCSTGGVACTSTTTTDASTPIREKVVCLANQELALWKSGQLKPGQPGYSKYLPGRSTHELWCADFSSWIYTQAGYPLTGGNGDVPAVQTIKDIGDKNQKFHYHDARSYTPRPGDLVIHQIGESHVSIVTGVSGTKLTMVGGDQSPTTPAGYPDGSVVSGYTVSGFSGVDGISGYVSPD